MFEVTANDCAKLDDRQLRELVGRLCEAELRARGLPVSFVTWGGDQNAGDGGVDVRVALPNGTGVEGFVPRTSVGFQVKKPDMPPAAIAKEMRPDNQIRDVIKDLADEGGAYIIVSAGSSSDIALRRRRTAMADAAEDLPNKDAIFFDYYDRTRLASWVRVHAGVTLWVRQQVGRALSGWEPFGAWAYPPEGTEAAFFLDDAVRIARRSAQDGSELDVGDGLSAIRAKLFQPKAVIRLVGLSGVGKTRFAQALFDQRVGSDSLDPTLAVYCNMNSAPEPQPVGLASNLIAQGSRAVLIIDNCGADLHRCLTDLVRQPKSRISVMTIEYDIRDDQPEETQVFELQAGSIDLIERLVRTRFPAVSGIDARTAAVESGGNARIAIALAGTVAESGTLSGMSDDALFRRLFVQRQAEDKPLMDMAQALALVYSYHSEDLSDAATGELHRLASIIDAKPEQLFRATSELIERDLAQQRGPWRAILPHAIANRLAAEALRRIPFPRINHAIVENGSERLIKSFSRRLGYLHVSPHAQRIVEEWFAPKGWLADVWSLNQFGKTIFTNVLPVAPRAGLAAIERSMPIAPTEGSLDHGYDFIRQALRSLAYDSDLFERSLAILEFLFLNADEHGAKEAGNAHASLFHLYLSGTIAPAALRIENTRRLLCSGDKRLRALGLDAFSALVEGCHFVGHGDYSFGARSRDYGWRPTCESDVSDWFGRAFSLMSELRNGPMAADMRERLADKFRGAWTQPFARQKLLDFCRDEARHGFWGEAWRAVKMTRYFDAQDRNSEEFKQLTALEELLRPTNLIDKVRGRVLARRGRGFDYDEYDDPDPSNLDAAYTKQAMEREALVVENLGEATAKDAASLDELLPDVFICDGHLWSFGRGLAMGAAHPQALWEKLVGQLARPNNEAVSINVLRGFLNALAEREPTLATSLLDQAVDADPLARHFPLLQLAVILDAAGVQRILGSIEFGTAPMWAFENLALGGATDPLTGRQLTAILMLLATKPGGVDVAMHILEMWLFPSRTQGADIPQEVIEAGRSLLQGIQFRKNQRRQNHNLCSIVRVCLSGFDAASTAAALSRNFRAAVAARETYAHDHNEFLTELFCVQPEAMLDAFLGGDGEAVKAGIALIEDASGHHPNPLNAVTHEALISWCQRDGANRFPAAAASVDLFSPNTEKTFELSIIATKLLEAAPNRPEIARWFARRCRPSSWSGSRATILESRAAALAKIDTFHDDQLCVVLEAELAALAAEAADYRVWEWQHDSSRDERFE